MSKGPWAKGPRNEKASKMLRDLREVAARERQHSNELILEAIENYGALSVAQLVSKTRLAQSTVQNALDRLRRDGEVKRSDQRSRVGKQGIPAYLYELGIEDMVAMKREPVQVIVRRDPFVEAFYGPYERRAA